MKKYLLIYKLIFSVILLSTTFLMIENDQLKNVNAGTWSNTKHLNSSGTNDWSGYTNYPIYSISVGTLTVYKEIKLMSVSVSKYDRPRDGSPTSNIPVGTILNPGTYNLSVTYNSADNIHGLGSGFSVSGAGQANSNADIQITPSSNAVIAHISYQVLLNSNPSIEIDYPLNNQVLSDVNGFNSLSISGTTQDSDVGDILSLKYQINSDSPVVFQTITANSSVQTFGPWSIDDISSIPSGSNVLNIWSEDNNGGISQIISRTFHIDRTPPTTPSNLLLSNVTETTASIYWDDSTDENGISGYEIYESSILIGSTSGSRNFIASGLSINTTYNFNIKAIDTVGNISDSSNDLIVNTNNIDYQFIYDAAGRLDYIILPSGEIINYEYDANGNLLRKELTTSQ